MQVDGIRSENDYVEIFSTDTSPLRLLDDIYYHASDNLDINWRKFHLKIHEDQKKYMQYFPHILQILRTDKNAVLTNLAGITNPILNEKINAINTRFSEALQKYRKDYLTALQTDYEGWRYEKWKAYVSSDFYFPSPWDKPIFNSLARIYNQVNPVFQKQSIVDQREGSRIRCLWMTTVGVAEYQRIEADLKIISEEVEAIRLSIVGITSGTTPEKAYRLPKHVEDLRQFEKIREYEFPKKKNLINGQSIPEYIKSLGYTP